MSKKEKFNKIIEKTKLCQACELHTNATNKVIGRGSMNPDVLFIGEAPGEEEDRTGKPFIGKSGLKLDSIIKQCNIENYAIINAVCCRPPGNRTPFTNELLSCRSLFCEKIALLEPKRIIALGKTALAQLNLPSDSIVSRIGTIEKSEFGDILILPHPAYLLRNPTFELPIEKIKKFCKGNEHKSKKKLVEKFIINKQKAEKLSKFEMISEELAALHSFCKRAGVDFVDVDQKRLCKINGQLAHVKRFKQTQEVDIFENDLETIHKEVKLFVTYVIEKGNIEFIGWINRETVDSLEMKVHMGVNLNCKKIMYDTLMPMNMLLKIYEEEIETEIIEEQPFVPLHVHSEYSIGDVYGSTEQYADSLYKKGFKACAITDHRTLAGTIYWQHSLLEKNIKPIFGVEANISMSNEKRRDTTHITLLAKNEKGWRTLNRLVEISMDSKRFYYRPAIFYSDLQKHHDDIICLSGCMNSYSGVKHRTEEGVPKAQKYLSELSKMFSDDFYVELMPNGIAEQKTYNSFLLGEIKAHNYKHVITVDTHYPEREMERYHKAVKAISYNKTYEESGFDEDTFYLLQADDIYRMMETNHPTFPKEMIDVAFQNSLDITEKCNFLIKPVVGDNLPKLYANPKEKLKELVLEGIKKHTPYEYKGEMKDRFDMEMGRFIDKNYENYFLIVHDYVKWCKENDIMVGPGRGSVGGSLAAYALNITETDPIKYDLLFDRFISEIRKDAPDIDLDFEDTKRQDLVEHLKEKYGHRCVANVCTYSTWGPKGAIRDIGRIFGIPIAEVSKVSNLVVERSGGDARSSFCLLDTFSEFEQAKDFYQKYTLESDTASALEGHIRHIGVHAAGVTIAEKPISEYVPVQRVGENIATAWEKKEIENMGLIKFDILGLKTMGVISDTIKKIKKRHGINVELPKEFNDPKVYERVFTPGKTLGVFQFETVGLSKLSKQLQIDSFKLLFDATTLYRPGPLHSGETATYILRKNKSKEWDYDHPLLKPITKDTLGLILYQEQVMKVMFELGKFSWSTAESARKIMTKSQGKDAFNKMRKEFMANAKREHDISEEESGKIFDVVSTFGSYGFNKSHAVEYSIISYWTAWLKTYYPEEFFATVLSRGDTHKIADYIREAKEFAGIEVKQPDINLSNIGYTFEDKKIITGFDSIKGIGKRSAEKIIKNQPYTGIDDYLNRASPSKSIFKALTCSGAFDEFYLNRKALYDNAELLTGKKSTRPTLDSLSTEEWDEKDRIRNMAAFLDLPPEKPLIDLYDNPYEKLVKMEKIGDLEFTEQISERWIKGIVTFINFKQEGLEGQWTMFDNVLERRYAHLNVTDGTGNVLVHLSPEQYTYYKKFLERGIGFPVMIKGHSIKDFNKIYCDAMLVLDDVDEGNPIISYIKGEHIPKIEMFKKKYPHTKVGMIENVTYKVSKNKNAYARLKITGNPESFLMCFKLTPDIFISGEVISYTQQDRFINIVDRVK